MEALQVGEDYLARFLAPFKRVTYTDAIDMLKDRSAIKWGDDLKSEHELAVVAMLGGGPAFITHYPKEIKFFNMRVNRECQSVVNSADLILPFSGESTGSAERENDYGLLRERLLSSPMFKNLQRRGKDIGDFMEYLEMVRQNPSLHFGCGIGFNRVSQSVLQVPDIRISTNYPINSKSLY